MIAKEIRNDWSDGCSYMCKISLTNFNHLSCVYFCIYTHPGYSKFTTWDSSQFSNNTSTIPPPPKFAKPRHYQKSSWDLVLFSMFSDRTSSTGIWITLYQIHYLRSIDLDIFTRMTIPISDFNQRTGFEHLTFRLRGKRPINCVTTEVNRTCMLIVITKRPWLGRRKMKCSVKASMLFPLNRSVMMVVTYQIFLYHTTGVSFVLLENNWS